jgi:hypothetical protein
MITILLMVGVVGVAAAYDLGNQAPVKPVVTYPENIPNPERQGGDTIGLAHVIPSLPYTDSGTTAGYTNDYDAVCPYTGGTAPDVVYMFTPPYFSVVDIDLCGSNFDTKLYVYDQDLNLIACNDDFYTGPPCGIYVSKLECLPLPGGETYDIVIDGYGSASGDYTLEFHPSTPPPMSSCPPEHVDEGEPPLVNGYVDNFNGGCNTPPDYPFQDLVGDDGGELVVCGVSGWYLYGGSQYRDTDWYRLVMGPTGMIEVEAGAEISTLLYELGPQSCGPVDVVQSVTTDYCSGNAQMTISGYPHGAVVWFWVGPSTWDAPTNPYEYDYVVSFSGLESVVATDARTWSTVKALYE